MSLFKGKLDSGNKFTVSDEVTGLEILLGYDSTNTAIPAYLQLESPDGTNNFMFWDNSGNLRVDTSAPDSGFATAGNVITGSSTSGANKTLSNLGTVAINTSIQSDADLGDDCGDASYQWLSLYARDLYLNSTATMKGTSAGQIDVVGTLTLGADGADTADMIWYGETTGEYMFWDGNAYDSASSAALLLKDNVLLGFGAQATSVADITCVWDGTRLVIEPQTDDLVIRSGAAGDLDWIWESKTGAGKDMGWVADIYTLQLADNTILQLGGSAIDTVTNGFKIIFDAGDTLSIDAVTAEDNVTFGKAISTDVIFSDGSDTAVVKWDSSEGEMLVADSAELIFGGGNDAIISSDGTLLQIDLQSGGTTGGIVIKPYAAATTAAVHIDGATAEWDGADNVGMLHLSNDAALIHAGASLLYVDSSAAPINSAGATCATFADTGTNVVTDPAYAVAIESSANHGLNIVTAAGTDIANLVLSGAAGQTGALIEVVGDTGAGWDGQTGMGCVYISHKSALAHALASALLIDIGTGTAIDAAKGYAFRIDDDSVVAASSNSYAACIDSVANHGLEIITQSTGMTGLTMTGKASATVSSVIIDGATGAFVGAEDVGMLHLAHATTDLAHVDSTLLRVESTRQPIASAMGYLARFEGEGTAQALASAVAITAKDNTEIGLNISAGKLKVAGGIQAGAIARAATVAGASTGTILAGESFITVTASDTDAIIILPTPTPGNVIWLASPTNDAYELRSSIPATVLINGSGGDSTESTIANADMLTRCVCVDATHWTITHFTLNGTESAGDGAT